MVFVITCSRRGAWAKLLSSLISCPALYMVNVTNRLGLPSCLVLLPSWFLLWVLLLVITDAFSRPTGVLFRVFSPLPQAFAIVGWQDL